MQGVYALKGLTQAIKALGGTALVAILFLLSACATIPVEQRPYVRQKIESGAETALAEFFAEDPDIEAAFQKSVGYFLGDAAQGLVGVVGSFGTVGVLYDKQKEERVFLNINSIDLGLGAGGKDFKLLVLFKTTEALEQVKEGLWVSGSRLETVSGTHGKLARGEREGWAAYALSKSGLMLGGSYALAKVEINRELTELGTSEMSLPNRGLAKRDTQGKAAPRKYDRELPFLAQKVVDKGFDLPLPWGFGLSVADVRQKMDLTGISVGWPGIGAPKEEYQAVSFDNTATDTRSTQVKLDAWLFPFMNVFAMAGQAKGDVQMDVDLDGNTILNRLGYTCTTPPPLIGLRKKFCDALNNKTFHLPVKADVNAFTYGVGTVLAAGLNNWFVSVPISANWVEPAGGVAYGVTKTVTPRGGRSVNLGRLGNFTAFGGGNWLESEYKIDGTFVVPNVTVIEYTITQTSKDPWNLVLGFNWDFTRRFSWSLEYNGFIGSREATISNFVVRF